MTTFVERAERIGWILVSAFIFLFVGLKRADRFLKVANFISEERKLRREILNSIPKRKLRHPIKMRIKYLTVCVQRISGWSIDQMFIPPEKRTES